VTDASSPSPQAGWYPDPHGAGQRYWDGTQWTSHVQASAFPGPYHGQAVQPTATNLLSIIAMVLGAIALIFCPILFGPAAIVLAALAFSKKERLAGIALAVAAIGMVGGFLFGVVVWSSLS
jgi:hypothetical protein